jgi:tRNA U34 2-thiouridine synthase MnmA/TrmU
MKILELVSHCLSDFEVEAVAQHLSIPVKTINFEKEYWNNVFQPMLDDYSEGVHCSVFD